MSLVARSLSGALPILPVREQRSTFVPFTEPGLRSVFQVAPELQPAAAAAQWIVVLGRAMLVLAFAYSTLAAARRRFDGRLLLVASSLGACPARVLWRAQPPLLLASIAAAAGRVWRRRCL